MQWDDCTKGFSIAINDFNPTIIGAVFKELHLMGYKVIILFRCGNESIVAFSKQSLQLGITLYRGIGAKLKVVKQSFMASFCKFYEKNWRFL